MAHIKFMVNLLNLGNLRFPFFHSKLISDFTTLPMSFTCCTE